MITEQGEDYATGCLLDYIYIKNHYPLIAADLSSQKELDADPIQLKKTDFNGKYLSVYFSVNSFRKTQRNDVEMFTRTCNSLMITEIADYEEPRIKFTNK